jgi:uncharacterized protein DUF3592
MRLLVRSPTQLIIRDSAIPIRVVSGFVLALGAFAMTMGLTHDPDGGVGVVPVVIGVLLGAAGLAMLVLPWRRTFAFSKPDHIFVLAKERFGHVERETIPLRDIKDVSLEESTSGEGGSTYRVAMTLADQRRVPWTSYYTSGSASKQAVVDIVREFLELSPTPALGSGTPTATDERSVRRGRAGLILMGVFCSLFLGVGVTMAAKEQRRLSVYQPVTATVLSTRVEEHSDTDGSTYEPVVAYRYRVQGREYTASRVTPLKESRSGRWASQVTAQYQIGSEHTAFYDPDHPEDAYLMRTRSVLPWVFIGLPLVAILFIGAAVRDTREMTKMSYRARSLG